MRRSNCAGALQYVPELTWILFLRILDEQEAKDAERAEAVGAELMPSLEVPYRWQDWAAPGGPKRQELAGGTLGAFKGFVDGELIPHLKKLKERPKATARQKVISEIFSGIDRSAGSLPARRTHLNRSAVGRSLTVCEFESHRLSQLISLGWR